MASWLSSPLISVRTADASGSGSPLVRTASFTVRAHACRVGVAGTGQRHRRRQHGISVESGIPRHERRKASDEQTSAHQQHKRKDDGGHNETGLEMMPSRPGRAARGFLLKRGSESAALERDERDDRKGTSSWPL